MQASKLLPLLCSLLITGSLVFLAVVVSDPPVFVLVLLILGSVQGFVFGSWCRWSSGRGHHEPEIAPDTYTLHWNPNVERRGLGDAIRSLNHVALIVSDVGRSLSFYVEVLGLQQIQRPNFDRHGAWLTLGNTELHLIKGVPVVPSGQDLIVSHMALETEHPELVLEKLIEMQIPFRQNISVPDPSKARDNLEESFMDSNGKVTQYFIRDPDGYYFELCNCDILTKFCLQKEAEAFKSPLARSGSGSLKRGMTAMLGTYVEGGNALQSALRCPILFKIGVVVTRVVRQARANLRQDFQERLDEALQKSAKADDFDEKLLQTLIRRQKTYSDITQGFTKKDLIAALEHSGNHCPTAILILMGQRQQYTVTMPPVYLVNEGGDENFEGKLVNQHVHKTPSKRRSLMERIGTSRMYAGAAFQDNDRDGYNPSQDRNRLSVATMLTGRPSVLSGIRRNSGILRKSQHEDADLGSEATSTWEQTAFRVAQRRSMRMTSICDEPEVTQVDGVDIDVEPATSQRLSAKPTLLGSVSSDGAGSASTGNSGWKFTVV